MAYSHRNGDVRSCGATTIVSGQNFVTVDGQLWAVDGDQDTDGAGQLITSNSWLSISGKGIIVNGDAAQPDDLCPTVGGAHCEPSAVGYDAAISIG